MELITENPYFFTATILEWKKLLKLDKFKQIIVNSLKYLSDNKRMKIYSFVIMENHVHIIWQSLSGFTYKENQLSFMKYTAQQIIKELRNNHTEVLKSFEVNLKDRKYQIWERNPLSIELINKKVYEQKLEYIHYNPVKAELCVKPEDYLFSSASFYILNDNKWSFLSNINE